MAHELRNSTRISAANRTQIEGPLRPGWAEPPDVLTCTVAGVGPVLIWPSVVLAGTECVEITDYVCALKAHGFEPFVGPDEVGLQVPAARIESPFVPDCVGMKRGRAISSAEADEMDGQFRKRVATHPSQDVTGAGGEEGFVWPLPRNLLIVPLDVATSKLSASPCDHSTTLEGAPTRWQRLCQDQQVTPLFKPGAVITRREVLHGDPWLDHPVTVVSDDGETLAVRLDPGSKFLFPTHPFGPHPWSHHAEWGGTVVLQLNRPDTMYGVWKIFEANGEFRHWYFNFEPPQTRRDGLIETGDYGLDLIVRPNGEREWKDVEDLHHQRAEGRITQEVVADVLQAAAGVVELLDSDDRWWSPWDTWTPDST